jgi:hypothetical protein
MKKNKRPIGILKLKYQPSQDNIDEFVKLWNEHGLVLSSAPICTNEVFHKTISPKRARFLLYVKSKHNI